MSKIKKLVKFKLFLSFFLACPVCRGFSKSKLSLQTHKNGTLCRVVRCKEVLTLEFDCNSVYSQEVTAIGGFPLYWGVSAI